MSVGGVGGKGDPKAEAAKAKTAPGASKFPPPKPAAGGAGGGDKAAAAGAGAGGPGAGAGSAAGAPPKALATGGFQIAKPATIKTVDAAPPPMRKEVIEFAQGMVQAADAASVPGPTSDGDLLPRESVSGIFMRDFALQGAIALGRPPLGEDEAARIVIERHIAGRPGLYYDAQIEAHGEDAYLVKLHKLNPNPPFLPEPTAEAKYVINRRTWQVEER